MPSFDDLNSILTWYQNYVGTFDKGKWEQSIEERILNGINQIPKKSAKVQSELIDLDLVRGSSFPKPKPKHGLFTTTRLAIFRFLFLPLFHKWWSAQTSYHLFLSFLCLYGLQVVNVFLYLNSGLGIGTNQTSSTTTFGKETPGNQVPQVIVSSSGSTNPNPSISPTSSTDAAGIQTSEIISPIILMIALTILHSQIVATHTSDSGKPGTDRRDRKNGRRRGSGIVNGLKSRKRRLGRVPPSRRRSSIHGVNNGAGNGTAGNSPSRNVGPVNPTTTTTSIQRKTLCFSSGNRNDVVISTSSSTTTTTCLKKVIFEDESKSLSSNSDKDEGIADEISETMSNENGDLDDDSVFVQTISRRNSKTISQSSGLENASVQTDTADTSTSTMSVGSELLADVSCPLQSDHSVSEYRNVHQMRRDSPGRTTVNEMVRGTDEEFPRPESILETNEYDETSGPIQRMPRSSIRNRNASKQSEASTTSVSCGELSSNNNESSSDEGDIGDQIDDEELRTKSEWTAVTTNSDDDDYGDEMNNSDDEDLEDEFFGTQDMNDHPFAWEIQEHTHSKFMNLNPTCIASDKVSCTIWEGQEAKKADLGVLEISSMIITKVDCARENSDYLYLGIFFSCILGILPACWRINSGMDIQDFRLSTAGQYLADGISIAFGDTYIMRLMILISIAEKLFLSLCVFFLLAVAEKTYKQRFLFAKLFSRVTSFRKARKSGIPHFRLNKVRNIKTWLSVRSYLQRRGPQRSVDIVVSATFLATFILIFFFSVELLKDTNRIYYLYNVEVMAWAMGLGIFLMRYMTLGSRVRQKYRNLSVIITEQLNLYLKMEQKPHKKEELLVANNVLKLASDLLKELEDPFKISSFTGNPLLYNLTRIVILSAFSGVLSEMLGFKLKLYNIKMS